MQTPAGPRHVREMLKEDKRYEGVLSEEERRELFKEYVDGMSGEQQRRRRLEREEQSKREREREVRRLRLREDRHRDEQRFRLLLDQAIAQFNSLLTEKIRHHNASWRESKKLLRGDERYANELLTSEKKEKLFRQHTKRLLEERYSAFRALLAETDKITMTSTWETARKWVEADPRFHRLPEESERERTFQQHVRDLYRKACDDYRALLAETKQITSRTPTSGPAYDNIVQLLRGDKRYRALEPKPEERMRLLEEHIAELKRKKAGAPD